MHTITDKDSARPRRQWRVLAGLVVGCLLAGSSIFTPSVADAAVRAVAPTGATATPVSPTEIAVNWTTSPDPIRSHFTVAVYLADVVPPTYVRVVTTCRWCMSIQVGGLSPGRLYSFRVATVDSLGRVSAPKWALATTPTTPCDPTTPICVSVDPTQVGGPLSHVGNGYNLGFTGVTPQSAVQPLAPRSWRISPLDRWALTYVRSVGASVSVLLSNGYAVGNWDPARNRVVRNPWEDWNGYRRYIVDTVRWHVANNLVPDEWEIQNEPDTGYYGSLSPATRALILEQFRVAHDAIRSVLPNAAIVGPTLGNFTVRNSSKLLDLTSFLDHAVAHNLRFDTIDWHELGTYQYGDADADPSAIVAHARTVRDLLAARPSLGSPRLRISEYTAPWYQSEPGASVRYFAALEQAGISSAQHSCFPVPERIASGQTVWLNSCTSNPGLLDGLRTSTGGTRADYWTHATYAAMNGTTLATTSHHKWVAALTTVAPNGTITALIGRAHGCNPGLQYRCPAGPDATAAAQLLLQSAGQGSPSAYRAVVQRIPNVGGVVAGPILVSDTRITTNQGSLTVPVAGGLADGDAVVITLTPA